MTSKKERKPDLNNTDKAIRRWKDTVWRLAKARMGNDADAADVFQSTFLALCHTKPQFSSLEHQKAWLLRTAINFCNQIIRKQVTQPTIPLDEVDIPDSQFEPGRDLELDHMLSSLSVAQRTAVHLFYFEGYTTDDIARITGEKPATVRSHLYRARQTLRIELEQNGDTPC